jgi:hypothetical protein
LGCGLGVLIDHRRQFLHGGRGLLQGAGLAFGSGRKIVVTLGNFGAGIRDAIGDAAH